MMHARDEKMKNNTTPSAKQVERGRLQRTSTVSSIGTPIRTSRSTTISPVKSNSNAQNVLINTNDSNPVNRENILLVYLDLQSESLPRIIASLESINNRLQTFNDPSICYDFLQTLSDRVFFICPTDEKVLFQAAHDLSTIEAIFLLGTSPQIDRTQLIKICGIYSQFEELLGGLREALEWFEYTQLNLFSFQSDRMFLWSQLLKDEMMKPTDGKVISNKQGLVVMSKEHYREYPKILPSINEFNRFYKRNDVLQWCFSSPFPSRFLHQSLRNCEIEHLDRCRFLFLDISYVLHRPNERQISRELYRGMKLSNDLLEQLTNHTGKLICPQAYFFWIKSKMTALKFASSTNYRTDLNPVLFKISCEPSSPVGEISTNDSPTQIVFDLYSVFRVIYVNRGPVSTVRLELADEDARSIVRGYRTKHKSETIQSLLDQLFIVQKPPVPIKRSLSSLKQSMAEKPISEPIIMLDQGIVEDFLKRNEIDQAIAYYQSIKPRTAQILQAIGQLYAEKKNDLESAINYYKEAIEMQEQNGEDPSANLSRVAVIYENLQQYDLAVSYYTSVHEILRKDPNANQALIGNYLLGLANSYSGQKKLSEALDYAQQALTINESITSDNDLTTAVNLGIIGNIQHGLGNINEALMASTRALTLLERSSSSDSLNLARLLNNIGAIQLTAGVLSDAKDSLDRALKIYEKILPEGHPTRTGLETTIRQINKVEQDQMNDLMQDLPDDPLPPAE